MKNSNLSSKQQPSDTEKELKRTQEYLDTIFLNIPAGIAIMEGPEFRYWKVNSRLAEINGVSVEDHLGRPLAEVLPDAAPAIVPRLRQVMETGEPSSPFEFSANLPKTPGETYWFMDTFFPIKGRNGKVQAVGAVVLDITARKRAETALQESYQKLERRVRERTQQLSESEGRLQTMIERAPDSIVYVKQDGTLESVNQRTEEIFGYDRDELIGQSLEMLLPERFRNQHRQHQAGYFNEPRMRPMGTGLELYGRRKDGSEFPVAISLSFMELENETLGCATIRDVTQPKEVREKLKQTQKELLKLSRHLIQVQEDERRRIARELHDQLGQDVALVSIGIEQLIQNVPESEAQLAEQLQRLAMLNQTVASEVQALSHRLHPSQLIHLGLVVAANSLCKEVSASSGIQIDFGHSDVPNSISQDVSTCLYRVLQESLGNMVKHSGTEQAQVTLTGGPEAIQLVVRDSGVGFDPEGQEETFGLGLIIMRERVHLVGGEFLIESQPSAGTRIAARVSFRSNRTVQNKR